MKQKILAVVVASIMFTGTAFAAEAAKETKAVPPVTVAASESTLSLKTDEDQLSYVFGLNMGMNFRLQQIAISQDAFIKGLNDGINGTAPAMTPAQIQAVLGKFQKEMMAKEEAKLKKQAEANLQAGKAYLEKNAAMPGVVVIKDEKGNIQMEYRVITAGKGPTPKATDIVSLVYDGQLIDGTTFDSTKRNGDKPVSLPLNRMIKGVQKALMMMPVGSSWEVVIAPDLAYGPMGVPGSPIGPQTTLVFKTLTLKGIGPAPVATK